MNFGQTQLGNCRIEGLTLALEMSDLRPDLIRANLSPAPLPGKVLIGEQRADFAQCEPEVAAP